jgi:hypothetical protein
MKAGGTCYLMRSNQSCCLDIQNRWRPDVRSDWQLQPFCP